MRKTSLTHQRLKDILHYDPETGIFTNVLRRRRALIGNRAGHLNKSTGYRYLRIDGRVYREHRVAFLYQEGVFPPDQVDHINRIRTDNRFVNLQHSSYIRNGRNHPLQSNNTSGTVGVSWCNRDERWVAKIKIKGRTIALGYFDDKSEAIKACAAANIKYGFHPNHGVAIKGEYLWT